MHIINDKQPVYSSSQCAITNLLQSSFIQDEDSDLTDKGEPPEENTDDNEQETTCHTSTNQCDTSDSESLIYSDIPHPSQVLHEEERLRDVIHWHTNFMRPPHLSNEDFSCFMCYCLQFFKDGSRLWRKDYQGAHKLVLNQSK